MIHRPKLVCVIYGGAGKVYARRLAERLAAEEEESHTPVRVKLILEEILSGDMVGSLVDLIKGSDMFVIFLTAEDVGGATEQQILSRVRQNVLLETGMALFAAGERARDKLLLVTDVEDPKKLDLPSDIASFSVKQFEKSAFEGFCDHLIKKIEDTLHVPSYRNLLTDPEYFTRYRTLFADADEEVFHRSGKNQLQRVLDQWSEDCCLIQRFDQKIIFLLERLPFFPIFGRHAFFSDWLSNVYHQVELSEHLASDLDLDALDVLSLCFEHTESRLNPDSAADESTHLSILNAFEAVVEKLQRQDNVNPVVMLCAHDYLGLTCLKLYSFSSEINHIQRAIEEFKICLRIIPAQDNNPGFWRGYIEYNLSRAYRELYIRGNGEVYADQAEKLLSSAVLTRKKWLKIPEYPHVFRNALSYEYFLARIEQIRLARDRRSKPQGWLIEQIDRIGLEVDMHYSEGEVLGQFSEIQGTLSRIKEGVTQISG